MATIAQPTTGGRDQLSCSCPSTNPQSVLCQLCQCAAKLSVQGSRAYNSVPAVASSSCPSSPLMNPVMDAHCTAFSDLHSRHRSRTQSRGELPSLPRTTSESKSPLFSSGISKQVLFGSNSNTSTPCTHSSSMSLDGLWLPQQWAIAGNVGNEADEDIGGVLSGRIRTMSMRSTSESMDDGDSIGNGSSMSGDGKHARPFRRTKSFAIDRSASRQRRGASLNPSSLSAKQRQFMRCACGKPWDNAEAGSTPTSAATSVSAHSPAHQHTHTLGSQQQSESMDIEDITARSEAEVRDLNAQLVEASPRLVVHVNESADYPVVGTRCGKCKSSQCMLVTGRKGFYLPSQIANHCTPDDCWISANGFVYDVTRYLHLGKHPGGAHSILKRAGDDATEDFKFHSKVARERIWRRYRIGRVAYCEGPKSPENCTIS